MQLSVVMKLLYLNLLWNILYDIASIYVTVDIIKLLITLQVDYAIDNDWVDSSIQEMSKYVNNRLIKYIVNHYKWIWIIIFTIKYIRDST